VQRIVLSFGAQTTDRLIPNSLAILRRVAKAFPRAGFIQCAAATGIQAVIHCENAVPDG
jgi:hypothetical protein